MKTNTNDTQKLLPFFASCPRGLEETLEKELASLGASDTQIKKSGVTFKALNFTAIVIALSSRVASRVFKEILRFKFETPEQLHKEAMKKWWHQVLPLDQTFKIKTILDQEANNIFNNSIYLSQKLKDAIADQYSAEKGARPDVSTYYPDVSLLQRIEKNKKTRGFNATILIDLFQGPLSNRGYRQGGHAAPLRENLAAGMVLLSDWKPKEETFIDPMCGTGTLIIEAILIKENILPTYLKIKDIMEDKDHLFAFLSHLWFLAEEGLEEKTMRFIKAVYESHNEKFKQLSKDQFFASDSDPKALKVLKENLKNSDIPSETIHISSDDALQITPLTDKPGVIICNPPYGERLGECEELKDLYHQFGENLKQNFKNYRAYILTSEPSLRKQISLRTKARIPLYNGNIECRLLTYELF